MSKIKLINLKTLVKKIDENEKPIDIDRFYTENINIGEPVDIKLKYAKFIKYKTFKE